ncbi:MAG TPA: hypothetical protein VG962_03395 [Steroidobacteraceae bacterium]|nr:hypothetical protein [Steroidobacteraceae bacterium]
MTTGSRFCSRIAYVLLRHAQAVMPRHRRDWVHAMHAELEHVEQHHALRWVIGCVIACYIERLKIMNRSKFIISRWLLSVEILVCFLPATILWIFAMLNMSSFIEKQIMIVSASLIIIVPINLWLGLRFVVMQRPLRYKVHVVSTLLLAVCAVLQSFGMQNPEREALFFWFEFDWGLIFMLLVLPALCCWHLSFFAVEKPVVVQ